MGLQNFSSYNDLLTGGVYAIPNYVTGTWTETGRQPTTETIGDLSWTTYQYRYEVFSTPNTYEQTAYVRENSITGTITGYSLYLNDLNVSNTVVSVGNTVSVSGTITATPPTGTTAVSGTVSVGNTVAVSGNVTATPTGTQDVNVLTSSITIPVSGTVTAIPTGTTAVSGSVTVSNTVAVSGSVTAAASGTQDVNILTSAITVPVSGAVTAIPTGTTAVSGTVSVGNTVAVSGSVTAAASGTQDVNILTSAITVPVSGSVTAIPTGTQAISGSVTAIPTGTQDVNLLTSSITVPVSGAVTAIPTGTQAIEITGSAAMDNGRLKVGLPDSEISTTGTLLTKFCSINASSATRTEITSGTAVANANMPAQNITYTVPAGKTFYLKQVWVEFDQTVTLGRLVTFDIATGAAASTIIHMITIARDTAGGLIANNHVFEKPLPIPAGTAIRIFVRTSGANSAVWLKYLGVEV